MHAPKVPPIFRFRNSCWMSLDRRGAELQPDAMEKRFVVYVPITTWKSREPRSLGAISHLADLRMSSCASH